MAVASKYFALPVGPPTLLPYLEEISIWLNWILKSVRPEM